MYRMVLVQKKLEKVLISWSLTITIELSILLHKNKLE